MQTGYSKSLWDGGLLAVRGRSQPGGSLRSARLVVGVTVWLIRST